MTRSKEDPADYILERLTDVPTVDYTREQNFAAWGKLLTPQEYIDRERVLGLSKIASSDINRLVVFGLKSKDNPDTLVSSLELLIRESWHFHCSADGSVVKKNILSGCLGGVYTYPEYRGKGLATIMVDKLFEMAKQPEYLGRDGFMFLYSEVGEYYTRNGFKSFAVPYTSFPLNPSGAAYEEPQDVTLIKYHEFGDLFGQYNQHFEKEMMAKVESDGIDRISINPTSQYLDWFHLRVKFFSTKIFGDNSIQIDPRTETYEQIVAKLSTIEPFYFGLLINCPTTGALKGFIAWQYEYDFDGDKGVFENSATVIKIFVNTPQFDQAETQLALISAMKKYLEAKHDLAQMSNFHKIVIWESEILDSVIASLKVKYGAVDGLENSSRSAIQCIDKEQDRKLKEGEMLWENNNKLPWF